MGAEDGVELRNYGDMWSDVIDLVKKIEGKIWVREREREKERERKGEGEGEGERQRADWTD